MDPWSMPALCHFETNLVSCNLAPSPTSSFPPPSSFEKRFSIFEIIFSKIEPKNTDLFRTLSNLYAGNFCRNNNLFIENAPPYVLDRVLNTSP